MAPLTAGSIVLPSCIPRFYGPPLAQVSSPWFRLYMYHCCYAGPISVLYVRGTRIRKLPEIFKNAEKIRLGGWTQEPNTVTQRTFLQTLNDSLLHSPTFVQVCEYSDIKVETFDVAFPYTDPTKIGKFFNPKKILN